MILRMISKKKKKKNTDYQVAEAVSLPKYHDENCIKNLGQN